MLKFHLEPFWNDMHKSASAKISLRIKRNIVRLIMDAIVDIMKNACDNAGVPFTEAMLDDDRIEKSRDLVMGFVPPQIHSTKKALRLIAGLYSMLRAEEEYEPTLQMSYVMDTIIHHMMHVNAENKNVYYRPLPEKVNAEIYRIMEEDEALEYVLVESELDYIERRIKGFEQPTYDWLGFYCFSNSDYLWLAGTPTDHSRESLMAFLEKALPDNPTDNEFSLPEDWLKSKKFHFIKEEKR